MVTAESPRRPVSKVMTWAEAERWRHAVSGRVVFTNGVFDLVHPGHVEVLDQARREGDVLIVGLNSDASVRRLKGPERPIRTAAERAVVLAAFEAVDAVVVFEEDTPLALVERLQPDVIVKGGDYAPGTIVGADVVIRRGGRVMVVPLVPDQSTTAIIGKLRSAHDG